MEKGESKGKIENLGFAIGVGANQSRFDHASVMITISPIGVGGKTKVVL